MRQPKVTTVGCHLVLRCTARQSTVSLIKQDRRTESVAPSVTVAPAGTTAVGQAQSSTPGDAVIRTCPHCVQ